jgi:flagellin
MAINDVSLTAGMRSNLVALQGTVELLNRTQERLSTGKKVNTALDNPLNFFTAKALNSRAADLAGYKDGMSEAVQTIKAANAGISGIEGLLAQAKAVAATAKAGVEGGTGSYSNITVDLASVSNGQTIAIGTKTFTAVATDVQRTALFTALTAGDSIVIGSQTFVASLGGTDSATSRNFIVTAAMTLGSYVQSLAAKVAVFGITTTGSAGGLGANQITLDLASSAVTWDDGGATATMSSATVSLVTTGETRFYIGGTDSQDAANLAARVNGFGEVTASVNAAKINILAGSITGTSFTSSTVTSADSEFTIVANQATSDRASYAQQFNDIMNQLDLLATDSGYKGINFLAANNTLDVEFGSASTDKITLTSFDGSSTALLDKASVGSSFLKTAENNWATNDDVDVDIAGLARAVATLKTESSRLSSGLSIINTRQDWVNGMVNTVTEGADKLTLADMNEEGANMLMLQTRQTLGTTALSLSAQAAQSVLRLFA